MEVHRKAKPQIKARTSSVYKGLNEPEIRSTLTPAISGFLILVMPSGIVTIISVRGGIMWCQSMVISLQRRNRNC